MCCRNRLEDGTERRRKEGETRVKKIGEGKKAQPVKYMSYKHGGVSSIPRTTSKSWAWWCLFVILILGSWRQADAWSFLVGWPA